MSDEERKAMLVAEIRATIAEMAKLDPKERFQQMVDDGLITPDGKLRWDESSDARTLGAIDSET